jgi:hypothetical protein
MTGDIDNDKLQLQEAQRMDLASRDHTSRLPVFEYTERHLKSRTWYPSPKKIHAVGSVVFRSWTVFLCYTSCIYCDGTRSLSSRSECRRIRQRPSEMRSDVEVDKTSPWAPTPEEPSGGR